MDVLINQITQIFENEGKSDRKESAAKALREIILSGLSRSGFLKQCPYLSKMDLFKDDVYYLLFLNQSGEFSRKEHWQSVNYELDGAGVPCRLIENEHGFSVEYEGIKALVFIYQKDFDLKSDFSYQQVPLPYELRCIVSMSEGIRAEIEKALDSAVIPPEPVHTVKNNKKSSGKGREKGKKKKESDDHWIQPSLFDF